MDITLKTLKAFCMIGAIAVLAAIFDVIRANQAECVATIKDIHRTVLVIGGAAGEVQKASVEWRKASEQSQQISNGTLIVLQNAARATASLTGATEHLDKMIQATDSNINLVLVPQLAAAVGDNSVQLGKLVADTDKTVLGIAQTSAQATAAMSQATQTLADAGKILGDPANQQTVQNVQKITANTAETTAHLDAAAADIQVKVHQMTRPASFVRRMAEAVLTLAAPVVSIFK